MAEGHTPSSLCALFKFLELLGSTLWIGEKTIDGHKGKSEGKRQFGLPGYVLWNSEQEKMRSGEKYKNSVKQYLENSEEWI